MLKHFIGIKDREKPTNAIRLKPNEIQNFVRSVSGGR